jgi:hypothetical protein
MPDPAGLCSRSSPLRSGGVFGVEKDSNSFEIYNTSSYISNFSSNLSAEMMQLEKDAERNRYVFMSGVSVPFISL